MNTPAQILAAHPLLPEMEKGAFLSQYLKYLVFLNLKFKK